MCDEMVYREVRFDRRKATCVSGTQAGATWGSTTRLDRNPRPRYPTGVASAGLFVPRPGSPGGILSPQFFNVGHLLHGLGGEDVRAVVVDVDAVLDAHGQAAEVLGPALVVGHVDARLDGDAVACAQGTWRG